MKLKKGFTLIEMLVVIAIASILVSVAYPSYQESIIESRRADAKSALMGFAQAMERYYTNNGTYTGAATGGADAGSPTIFSTTSPIDGSDVYYNLKIQSATSNTYTLSADPVNAQGGDGMLTLASTGARGWDSDDSGTVESDEACWETSCN
jgi:type IV pilus assembly protein PilE